MMAERRKDVDDKLNDESDNDDDTTTAVSY